MLYYRDFESYEGQSRHESSDRRSGLSAKGQLVVEWLRSTPRPLDGMPRGNEEGVPRFSGHPDDLIWFLEDVRDLCMQAGCFEDCEWAQWCPAVCYSKHDLYDLVDKQKKVKIDSYQALLNYRLSFTDIAAQLQISSQLSWIEKDDLFLEGFNRELQGKILRRLKWSDQRQYVDDPWPTYQDSSKPSKAPGVGSRSQVIEVDGIKVAVAEPSSSALVEGRCESSFEHIEVTSYIAKESLTAVLQGECLQGRLEERSEEKLLGVKASVELEVTEAWGDSPVSQPKYSHSSLPPHTNIQPQIPPIELRDAEDEQRVNKRPVEAVACATEVPKPTLEPRGDLCEVPERARSIKVEEIELEVEAKGQSKGWTWSLGVETCMMSPSALSQPAKRSGTTALRVNNAHSLAPRTCSAAAVEIYTGLSQKSENYLFEGYEVYEGKVKAPHSGGWSAILESTAISTTRKSTKEAALRVRTPQILYKKKWMPPYVKGEVRRLYGVLCRVFKATRLGIEPKQSPGPHWHSGQDLSLTLRVFMFFLECMKVSEESDEHETPSRLICLLWRVFSVFLEDALWSGELLSRPLLQSGNPALSHWTLTLVRGLMFSRKYLRVSRTPRESEEVAKRSPSLDIRSSKNPSKVKRQEDTYISPYELSYEP
ncbi:hypothetical protein F5141DRAFT_1062528 [Pisolithus sp. B1]|nr:hypothetical protein F5141DRAFT_1062528 [Pisolithus sp. B1]